jgi:hypothetical protein
MSKIYFPIILSVSLILTLSSCADDPAAPEEETQDEHVCEHLLEGPAYSLSLFTSKSAALDAATANAENLLQNRLHTRYDLTLPQDGDKYEGWLAYKPLNPAAGDGDFVLYSTKSNSDVQITIQPSDAENLIAPEHIWDHSDDCELIRYKALYPLEAAKTYVLHFQSESHASVSVLLPRYTGEEDHDH